jgi:hypothetical protein
MFITVQVPRSATIGTHTINLYGARAIGLNGSKCVEQRRRPVKIATTTVFVTPG